MSDSIPFFESGAGLLVMGVCVCITGGFSSTHFFLDFLQKLRTFTLIFYTLRKTILNSKV